MKRSVQRLDRGVVAVAATFLVNGGGYPSLLPRLPQVRAELALSEATLGFALVGMGAGGLVGSLVASRLVHRWGGKRVTTTAGWSLATAMVLPAVVVLIGSHGPAWVWLGLAIAAIGWSDAVHDIAMNHVALAEQRRVGQSILGRLHALWSAGALAAAAIGALMAALEVPLLAHLAGVAVAMAALQRWAGVRLPEDEAPPDPATRPDRERPDRERPDRERRARWRAGAVLGAAAVAAAFVEGPAIEWSAVHLRDAVGASPGVAGLGPAMAAGAMLVGRLMSDRAIERLGPVTVARLGAGIAGLGVGAGLLFAAWLAHPLPALLGYAAVGLGSAPMFPLLFTAGAHTPGRAAAGASIVSGVSRVGFLAAPAVVGVVGDLAGLGWGIGLVVVPGAAALALLLPRRLRSAATGG